MAFKRKDNDPIYSTDRSGNLSAGTEDYVNGMSYEGDPRENPDEGPTSNADPDGGAPFQTPTPAPAQHLPQPSTPGLIDDVLSYPKAALGGFAAGWNQDPMYEKIPALNDKFGADMAKHPSLSGGAMFLGHGYNGPGIIPGVPIQVRPELAGDLYGGPDAPASSSDSKLGAQGGKDRGVVPAAQSNPGSQYGIDKDTLDELLRGGAVPMEHMQTEGIEKGFDKQIGALPAQADAEVKANDASGKVYKNLTQQQQANEREYKPQMDRSIADQRDFTQRAAAATEAYENTKIDPEHYWNSMDTPKKIWTMASMVLGGAGAGVTHGPNYAAQRISDEIQRDTEAQLHNRDAHLRAGQMYHGLAGIAHQTFGDVQQAASWVNAQKFGEAGSLLKYIGTKYADPAIRAKYEAAAGQLMGMKDKTLNDAAEAENKARVESAQAGAMMRQANGGILGQLNELQKMKFAQDARDVVDPDTGKVYHANSPAQAEEIRKQLAANTAARAQLGDEKKKTGAYGAADKMGFFAGPGTAGGVQATIEGLLQNFPAETQKQLREAIGSGRFGSQQQALEAVETLLKNQRAATLSSIGGAAPGRADQIMSQ